MKYDQWRIYPIGMRKYGLNNLKTVGTLNKKKALELPRALKYN
jgi:hypothetical protein